MAESEVVSLRLSPEVAAAARAAARAQGVSLSDLLRAGLKAGADLPSVLLEPAVAESLSAADLASRHGAAAALLRRYAVALDATAEPALLDKLGPKFLAALVALGLTPATPSVAGPTPPVPNPAPSGDGSALGALRDEVAEARARRTG